MAPLLFLLAAFFIRRHRKARRVLQADLKQRNEILLDLHRDNMALMQAWHVEAAAITLLDKLDEGTFGEVWRAD